MGKNKFLLKYVGLPLTLATATLWNGDRILKKGAYSENEQGNLVFVQMYHRHGDRTAISHIHKDDPNREHQIWIPILAHQYSPVRLNTNNSNISNNLNNLNSNNDNSANSSNNTENSDNLIKYVDNQPKGDIYQWNNVASRLQSSHLLHKQYNNIPSSEIYLNSRNPNCNEHMTRISTWDSHYPYPYCGQLSDRGVTQLQELGRWLRLRYINKLGFLSPSYDLSNNKLYYITTNFARTIYSADSLISGLYPFNRENSVNNHSNYDIITSVPMNVDYMKTFLYPQTRLCPRLRIKNKESEEYLKIKDNEMNPIKERVANAFGHTSDQHPLWFYFSEAVICRLEWGRDVPEGLSGEDAKTMATYAVERTCTRYGRDREALKLSYGVLLEQLVFNLKHERNRFVINSCHDNTILGLLVSCSNGELNFPWPGYAASVVFEVWEKTNKDKSKGAPKMKRYVRCLYEKHVLHWPGGKEFMAVDELENMWKDVMVDEKHYLNVVCPC